MNPTTFAGTGRGDFHTIYQGQSVDDLIIDYMQKNNIPGMSLAIVQAPYITRVVSYGLAELNSKRLVGTHAVFNIGQLTNAFTAVAIMQLKEANKLKLDDPIAAYLNHLPAAWQKITIRQLITQSSGLPSYTQAKDFDYSKNYNAAEIPALIAAQDLLFQPGTKVSHSATNHYLLGLIIEKASGMSYQDFISKNQIERIGLKHTFFIANKNSIVNEVNNGSIPFKHKEFLHNPVYINPIEWVTGYGESNQQLKAAPVLAWQATFADSGLIASAEDISLWDIALAGDLLIKDADDRKFLYNPVKSTAGKIIPGNSAWFFPGHPSLMEIKGNVPGYSAFLSRFTAPTELLCVTLLANKENLPDLDILARKIAAAFDEKLAAPPAAVWAETMQSPYSVAETLDRITQLITSQGGTIFARIDHSAAAQQAGLELAPTQVLIIGNPSKGTALMQANPSFALDLPLRIMATEGPSGEVWLSYTDPAKMAKEYHVQIEQGLLQQMSQALAKLCHRAIAADSL